MPEAAFSVRELLELPPGGLPADILRAGIPDAELDSFRTQVTSAMQGMPFGEIESAVREKFAEALEIDPVTLWAGAWQKYSLLSDAVKKSKSGETVLVPMAEHTVKSVLHPYVEIQWGTFAKKIELEVTLSVKLKGVVVKVEAGEIRAIQAGTCEGSAEVAIARQSIWKHAIKPISLAGTIKLGKGIPIRDDGESTPVTPPADR